MVAKATELTRSQARKQIRHQKVTVNGEVCQDPSFHMTAESVIELAGEPLFLEGPVYLMLNKPDGYICSTQDEIYPSALNLIESKAPKLHFAGRLDVDTTGLVLISNNGQWTHQVTSPKSRCNKTYRVTTFAAIDNSQCEQLSAGVMLKGDDQLTAPAEVQQLNSNQIRLSISEGRYHQVKRMLAAVGNHVTGLHREKIGQVCLGTLGIGESRTLSQLEIDSIND